MICRPCECDTAQRRIPDHSKRGARSRRLWPPGWLKFRQRTCHSSSAASGRQSGSVIIRSSVPIRKSSFSTGTSCSTDTCRDDSAMTSCCARPSAWQDVALVLRFHHPIVARISRRTSPLPACGSGRAHIVGIQVGRHAAKDIPFRHVPICARQRASLFALLDDRFPIEARIPGDRSLNRVIYVRQLPVRGSQRGHGPPCGGDSSQVAAAADTPSRKTIGIDAVTGSVLTHETNRCLDVLALCRPQCFTHQPMLD